MASYVKFTLEDGTEVFVETAEPTKGTSGLIPASRGEENAQQAASFEKSFGAVRKMAAVMLADLREGFAQPPDEVSISFGLKAAVELGNLVIARGGMETNYSVNLRWRNKPEEKPEDKKD